MYQEYELDDGRRVEFEFGLNGEHRRATRFQPEEYPELHIESEQWYDAEGGDIDPPDDVADEYRERLNEEAFEIAQEHERDILADIAYDDYREERNYYGDAW